MSDEETRSQTLARLVAENADFRDANATLREALDLIGSNSLADDDDVVWVARRALEDWTFADLPSAPDWFKAAALAATSPEAQQ